MATTIISTVITRCSMMPVTNQDATALHYTAIRCCGGSSMMWEMFMDHLTAQLHWDLKFNARLLHILPVMRTSAMLLSMNTKLSAAIQRLPSTVHGWECGWMLTLEIPSMIMLAAM